MRRNIRRAKRALRSLRNGNRPHPRQPLLDALLKGGAGAEIGVWKGEFSHQLLSVVAPSRLVLVDPWKFQGEMPGRWYGGLLAKSQRDMDRIHQQVADDLAHRPEVEILRATSTQAAAEVEDGSLDWVYIDGDHSYEAVLNDLDAWWDKVKVGGLVTGDDYLWRPEDDYPVKRAVNRFVEERGLELWLVQPTQFAIRR